MYISVVMHADCYEGGSFTSSQTFPKQLISDREVFKFDVWFFEVTTRS